MAQIAGSSVNLIQAQHLIFAHLVLMGVLVLVVAKPGVLNRFAGPLTGERELQPG